MTGNWTMRALMLGAVCLVAMASGCKKLSEPKGMKAIKEDMETYAIRQDTDGRKIGLEYQSWRDTEKEKKGAISREMKTWAERQDSEGRKISTEWNSFLENM